MFMLKIGKVVSALLVIALIGILMFPLVAGEKGVQYPFQSGDVYTDDTVIRASMVLRGLNPGDQLRISPIWDFPSIPMAGGAMWIDSDASPTSESHQGDDTVLFVLDPYLPETVHIDISARNDLAVVWELVRSEESDGDWAYLTNLAETASEDSNFLFGAASQMPVATAGWINPVSYVVFSLAGFLGAGSLVWMAPTLRDWVQTQRASRPLALFRQSGFVLLIAILAIAVANLSHDALGAGITRSSWEPLHLSMTVLLAIAAWASTKRPSSLT